MQEHLLQTGAVRQFRSLIDCENPKAANARLSQPPHGEREFGNVFVDYSDAGKAPGVVANRIEHQPVVESVLAHLYMNDSAHPIRLRERKNVLRRKAGYHEIFAHEMRILRVTGEIIRPDMNMRIDRVHVP
jgi:hypothetical protein